jgi:hypothetical protein
VTTNTAEGLFSNLRRQLDGTHHHVSQKHLGRYLSEYDFKYNNREMSDTERTELAIKNAEGKRLALYQPKHGHVESLIDRKEDDPSPRALRRAESSPDGKPEGQDPKPGDGEPPA